MKTREIYSDLPIPPGEFLVEVLKDLGMGKDELARRMNRPAAKLGHILLHSKQQVYIESDDVVFVVKDLENEANEFASDNLIPTSEFNEFVEQGSFYKQDILRFAKKVNIHSGIVVGRLHHDKLLDPSWCSDLRQRYTWKN